MRISICTRASPSWQTIVGAALGDAVGAVLIVGDALGEALFVGAAVGEMVGLRVPGSDVCG